MSFLDCWQSIAATLFSQALAGEPELTESVEVGVPEKTFAFAARVSGDIEGRFSITLDASLLDSSLIGEVPDRKAAWAELLQEVTHAAAGDLLAKSGVHCRIEGFDETPGSNHFARAFLLRAQKESWCLFLDDGLREVAGGKTASGDPMPSKVNNAEPETNGDTSRNVALFLDVELEATLRFGRRELKLAEILDMGPGDVVELDRQVTDPVDLIVGDKVVARGEVVLVNGNFGLRVTEVATPTKRLETVRCLF